MKAICLGFIVVCFTLSSCAYLSDYKKQAAMKVCESAYEKCIEGKGEVAVKTCATTKESCVSNI